MDAHIVGEPALDNAPPLRARLPGEPEPGFDAEMRDEPLQADPHTVPPTASAPRSTRRRALLAGVATVAAIAVVGGGILASPYNGFVRFPPGVRQAMRHAETQIALLRHHAVPGSPQRAAGGAEKTAEAAPGVAPPGALPSPSAPAVAQPLAPSAALAGLHPQGLPPAVVQPAFKPQPPDQELAELLNYGRAAAAVPAQKPGNADGSHPRPAGSGAVAQANSGLRVGPAAAAGPPAGYVPQEPGAGSAAAAAPEAGSVLPVSNGTAGHPAAQQSASHPSVLPNAQPADNGGDGREAAGATDVLTGPNGVAAAPGQGKPGARSVSETTDPAASKLQVGPSDNDKATRGEGQAEEVRAASSTSADALSVARELRAAPMSSDQQVQVLELVTQLATLIRNERTAIGDLQVDLRKSAGATSAKLSDFERRLALVEAGTAMAEASGPLVAPPSTGSPEASRPSAVPVALTSAKAALADAAQAGASASAPQAPPVGPKQFRVQAASPGLAMLAEVDRGGGDGAQVAVQVGDTVPGYGRVLSVGQSGTSWVVKTEHGTIQ